MGKETKMTRFEGVDLSTMNALTMFCEDVVQTGWFPGIRGAGDAIVKIQTGAELGIAPIAAIQGISIIKGKPVLSANMMAGLVRRHPRYDYRVQEHDSTRCVIEFTRDGDVLGTSEFTMDDAKRAGLLKNPTWGRYPKNMLFARAMSNGIRFNCPDITMAPLYTPEELGGDDETLIVPDEPVRVQRGPDPEPELVEDAEIIDEPPQTAVPAQPDVVARRGQHEDLVCILHAANVVESKKALDDVFDKDTRQIIAEMEPDLRDIARAVYGKVVERLGGKALIPQLAKAWVEAEMLLEQTAQGELIDDDAVETAPRDTGDR